MGESMISSIEQLENGTVADKIIEIKSIYKNGKTTVQPVKDPLTGWYKGLLRLSDDDKKKLKFWAEPSSKFILKDGVVFDLNKEEHKVIWEWVKFQPCLAKSFDECQHKSGAEFYIYMRHKEATERVSHKLSKHKAVEYVLKDNSNNYPLRAKLLGIPMDGEDATVIQDFLLEQAETAPDRIIKIYEDRNLSVRMLLLNAIEKRKLIIEPSGAYRYGNIVIGMSEDSAVEWLSNQENKSTASLLESEVNPEYFENKSRSLPKDDVPELKRK